MRHRVFIIVTCIYISFLTACSCLRDNLQGELDHNPVLVQRQIRVKVRHINPNGFIYLTPQAGLSQNSLCAIANGESIAKIAMRDPAAVALVEAEQTLKRRPEVKGVAWIYVGDCGVAVVEEPASIQDFCPEYWLSIAGIFALFLAFAVGGIVAILVIRRRRTRAAA